jgi:iron complex outermembrane receptor protein
VRFRYALTFALTPPADAAHIDTHPSAADAIEVSGEVHAVGGGPAHDTTVGVQGTALLAAVDGGRFALRDVPAGPFVLVATGPGGSIGTVVVEREGHAHVDVVIDLAPPPPPQQTVVRGRTDSARRALTQEVAVIDAAALTRVRGRSLAATLSEVPGVTMVQSGPGVAKPVVRGVFGRRVMLLTDGVRHEGQDWGIDHAPEIDPQLAERIEVVKGAAGVRYGPDAIGGVVLLEPRLLRTEPGIDGALSLFAVDNGLRGGGGGRIDLLLPELPQLALRLEANGGKGAAVSTPDYVLGNTASEHLNIGAAAQWQQTVFDVVTTVKLSLRRRSETIGICYCLSAASPDDLAARAERDAPLGAERWRTRHRIDRPRQEVTHDLGVLRTTLDFGPGGELSATYGLQLDQRAEFDQVRRSVSGAQFTFWLMSHTLDVVYAHPRLALGRFALVGQVGLQGMFQEHVYSGLQLIPNYRRMMGGLFVLERLIVDHVAGLGDLELVFGARADGLLQSAFLAPDAYATQKRIDPRVAASCTVTDTAMRCEKNAPAGSVTAGVRQHIALPAVDQRGTLQLDLSSASRFPDVDELYLGGRAPSFPVFGVGNAALGTERALQLSLSGTWTAPWIALDAGTFASRIADYIVFGPALADNGEPQIDVLSTGAYPRFTHSATTAALYGADGGVLLFPRAVVSLAAQLAIVRGIDLDTGRPLPFIPPAQGRLEARVNLPAFHALQTTRIATGFVAAAQQEPTGPGLDFAPPPPGYLLWQANAQTELRLSDVPVLVGLEVRNALNQRYREPLSLMRYFADEPGREVWLRLETRFDRPL